MINHKTNKIGQCATENHFCCNADEWYSNENALQLNIPASQRALFYPFCCRNSVRVDVCVCVCSPVCLQCVHLYTLSLHHCNMFGNCIAAVWHSEMRALRIMKWKCQSSVVNMPIFDICTLSLAQEIFKNNCFRIAIRFISLPHKDKQTPFRNIICRMGEIFGSVFLIRLPSMFVDLIEVIIDPSRNSTSLAKFLSMLSLSTSPHRIAICCCCDQAGHLYVSIVCIFDWINKFVYV